MIDAANPLDFSGGFPPKLAISGEDSLGERVQRALPEAKVVKVFNTIGSAYFVDPSFADGEPTMLIAGDDEDAKRIVGDVLADLGWPDPVDLGGIEGARNGGDLHRLGEDRRRTRRLGSRLQAAGRLDNRPRSADVASSTVAARSIKDRVRGAAVLVLLRSQEATPGRLTHAGISHDRGLIANEEACVSLAGLDREYRGAWH